MTDAFTRLDFEGHELDRLTLAAYEHGADILGATPNMSQGSFTDAFGPSGGTHSGSGAFDLDPPPAGHTFHEIQRAYRWGGCAAWHRPFNWDGRGGIEHVHVIVIGDAGVSIEALNQVHDYHAGLNGLANHGIDPTWRPNPILAFHYPLATVELAHVAEQATAQRKTVHAGVRHVQHCLNLKRHTALALDGIFGPKTRAAYKRWELQVGGDGDGIPGAFALKLLGASQFSVVTS